MRYAVLAVAALTALWLGRLALLRTRASRARSQFLRASAAPPRTTTERVMALLAWPVFFVLVAVVVAIGLFVGWLVGRR
jgi:ABC-type uncharacterized transport system permease subunit